MIVPSHYTIFHASNSQRSTSVVIHLDNDCYHIFNFFFFSGGEGIESPDVNNCAIECYNRDKCVYWVYVEGWKKNCFLKSHFEEEEEMPNGTSGSIGLSCS